MNLSTAFLVLTSFLAGLWLGSTGAHRESTITSIVTPATPQEGPYAQTDIYCVSPPPPLTHLPRNREVVLPRASNDRVYYLDDGRRVQESPGGMRIIEQPRR